MIRLAVIGLGYWGPNLVRNAYAVAGEQLRMCCDRDAARLQAIAKLYPSIQMVADAKTVFDNPDIDAVAIATPVGTHHALARAALLAGKHVLVEKPLTGNIADAEDLVRLAERQRKILMVDHVYVYSPAVRKIKELIDTNQLGKILFIDSVRINLGQFQRDVNVVWDLAPHDLSIVDYLVGRPPRSIASFGAAHANHELEDVAYLNLDFGEGLIANFHVNWLSPVKIRYIMIAGSQKSIIYNDLHPAEIIKVYDSGVNVREADIEDRRRVMIDYRLGDIWSPHVPQSEPLHDVITHFIECCDHGKTPLTDGAAGLRLVRVLDAAQRSIKAQGGRITL